MNTYNTHHFPPHRRQRDRPGARTQETVFLAERTLLGEDPD